MTQTTATDGPAALRDLLARVWGYDSFRPLQQPAMEAILDDRPSSYYDHRLAA